MLARQILGASTATAAGIMVVAGVSKAVDNQPAPAFSLTQERFSQETFQGRFYKMVSNFDPSTLLATEADIRRA